MIRFSNTIGLVAKKADLMYLLQRILLAVPTMFGVVAVVFFFTRAIGNPVAVALGDRISEQELAARISALGYDRPIAEQFFEYLAQVISGNLGVSVRTGESVNSVIAKYLPATIELGGFAIAIAFPISIWLGRFAYRLKGSAFDSFIQLMALLSYALPVYLVAILLRLTFSTWLGLLPASGRASLSSEIILNTGGATGFYILDSLLFNQFALLGDLFLHSVLPVTALALSLAGTLVRTTRSAYISASKSPVVEYARAMRVSEATTEKYFIARPSRSRIISVFGLSVAAVLTGVVFTETTFEWRGLGYAMNHYIAARDFDVVQGLALVLSFIVVLVHGISDWLARLSSPKIYRKNT
jgi:peptide/nickel transport system permease protein